MRWLSTAAVCLAAAAAVAVAVATAAPPSDASLRQAAAALRSPDRSVRLAAASELVHRQALPEFLAGPAIELIKLEIEHAAATAAVTDLAVPRVHGVPPDPAAVTFAQIKAQPAKYIGTPFVMIGQLELGRYYGYGFANAAREYYSLTCRAVDREGKPGSDHGRLYLLRFLGRSLADRIERAEHEPDAAPVVARLWCTIDPERCDKPEDAVSSVRVVDWQLLRRDGKTWTPWLYEGVNYGFDILLRTGPAATERCVDLALSEQVFQDEDLDWYLRGWAILRLVQLPRTQQTQVLRWLPQRVKQARSAKAQVWGTRAYNSLFAGRLLL
jgi:hypothetical protein